MNPKSYLQLVAQEWELIVKLFEANKFSSIDHMSLIQIIDNYKKKDSHNTDLLNKFIEFGILEKPLSTEDLYQLGALTEYEVRHLLYEQRLGLSESIQNYISKLENITQDLLKATIEYDQFAITDNCKKIRDYTQDVKREITNNFQAIRNIVAESKKQETAKPLKQRYADVIFAWEQYINPMGDMIDIQGAFSAIIDISIKQIEQATEQLEKSGALISQKENVQLQKNLLDDMRWHILIHFQQARDILKPLYDVARLNSKVTRGASIVVEHIQKSKWSEINQVAYLELFNKPRMSLISIQSALMKYYYECREIKNNPSPTIPSFAAMSNYQNSQLLPFDMKKALNQLKAALPIDDIVAWSIQSFPDIATHDVLDIVLMCYNEKGLKLTMGKECTNKTATHFITGKQIKAVKNEK